MSEPHHSQAKIDIDQALTYAAGDHEMLISMAELFATEGPRQLSAIDAPIKAGDMNATARAAHQLKGSVVIFGAASAASAALQVEQMAAQRDADKLANAWDQLKNEIAALLSELQKLPQMLDSIDKPNNPTADRDQSSIADHSAAQETQP